MHVSSALPLSLSPCARSLTWAGVSVFLGRLAITRPPALTIPATIGKAQYRTYGGSGRRGAAAGRNGKRVLEARTNNRISTEFVEFVPTRGILWNKEPSPRLTWVVSSPPSSPSPTVRVKAEREKGFARRSRDDSSISRHEIVLSEVASGCSRLNRGFRHGPPRFEISQVANLWSLATIRRE